MYSTKRNSEGLLSFILEPEKVYRRRLNKLASRRILEDLGSQSLSDIHSLFLETNSQENINTSVSDIMGEYFTQLDFSQIASQPHRLPDKVVEKLPMFTGTDATTSTMQLRSFCRCVNAFISDPAHQHDDVYMHLFDFPQGHTFPA